MPVFMIMEKAGGGIQTFCPEKQQNKARSIFIQNRDSKAF